MNAFPGSAGHRAAQATERRLARLVSGRPPDRRSSDSAVVDAVLAAARAAGCKVESEAIDDAEIAASRGALLVDIAARLDVPIRPIDLDAEWPAQPALPIIIDGAPPTVLLTARSRLRRLDLDSGALHDVSGTAMDGAAYVVYAGLGTHAVGLRGLLRAALGGGSRRDAAQLAIVAAIAAVLGLTVPLLTGAVVGRIIPTASRDDLVAVGVTALLAGTAALLVAIAQGLYMLRIASRTNLQMTSALWYRVARLPVPTLRARPAGELAQRVFGLDAVRALITSAAGTAIVVTIGGLASLLAVAILDLTLAAAIGAVAAVSLFVGTLLTSRLLDAERRRVDASVEMNGLVVMLFSGLAKLRVAAAEERARARWAQRFGEIQRAMRDSTAAVNALFVIVSVIPGVVMLTTVVVLGQSAGSSLGTVATAAVATGGLSATVAIVVPLVPQLAAQVPLLESTRPLLTVEPESARRSEDVGELEGRVELRNLTYGYCAGRPVLRDVNVVVPAGSFTAIVGPSGAGKSTLVGMLLGFDRPWSGSVLYDNRDVSRLRIDELRRAIGTVTQDGRTAPGTVLDAILGTSGCAEQDAWNSAEMVGIAAEIRAMPMGMSTVLSEGGAGLSGGQLQRLMLARALVRRPRIIILDEATSALDSLSQSHIAANLASLGATRIVVAHRLSTIRQADQIVVLDEGRVADTGTYDSLLRRSPQFQTLARRQEV
ncbi:MAG: ATP-binding cassette domain-containing protein [Actinomycetota bacterium]